MKEAITVIKTLPENDQHRVNALKHLQEGKYQELCQPLGDRRKASEFKVGEAEWKVESKDEVDVEVTERFKWMALNLKNQHSKIFKPTRP
ncbi:nucleosome assembly protein [Culex quinquefasciatus]|uniref:Nucleosome assembly protein n=1 Tax=Culex quinquefasciatus TaxID=7176 RepID=B0X6N9_CULQU|nr:nucleosome assembly protein [Culex quinquefasciatus]|eukprot:XP_001865311.1 nucleosome assembly protein [Culex quinquefasciatus]